MAAVAQFTAGFVVGLIGRGVSNTFFCGVVTAFVVFVICAAIEAQKGDQ